MDLKISTPIDRRQFFTGSIPVEKGAMKMALDYAAEYADKDEIRLFYNTINAVKADGTSNELIVNCEKALRDGQLKKSWVTKYGDYEEIFPFSRGDKIEMRDVFNCVIRLGKAIFGDLILSRPNLRYENAYSAKVSSIDIEKRAKAVIEEAKEIQKNAIDVLYNI